MLRRKYKLLSYNDRKKFEKLYQNNKRLSDIAKELGVHIATIYRELQRGITSGSSKTLHLKYSAEVAQHTVETNLKMRGRKKGVNR